MTIITVTRGSYSMGKDVAEQAAQRLGYECISRDILLEASDKFNIPEIKLTKAFVDAPSILDRFTHGQQKYIAYIQSALTRHVCKDNVVYHGLAGHVLLKNISHVLKVCVTASFKRRVSILMERENVTEQDAMTRINKVDKERQKWTQSLYNVDPWDLKLYDISINVDRFNVEDSVDIICQSAKHPSFQTTDESQRSIEDFALACEVRAELVDSYPDISVASTYGNVLLYTKSGDDRVRKLESSAKSIGQKIKGINNIEVHAGAAPPPNAV